MWKQIADMLIKVIENGDLDANFMPIFGCIAPLFLLKVNGNLGFDIVDENLLYQNPLLEPLLMDAATLVSSLSNVNSEDD